MPTDEFYTLLKKSPGARKQRRVRLTVSLQI